MKTLWVLVVLSTTGNQSVGWFDNNRDCADRMAEYHSALRDVDTYQGIQCADTGIVVAAPVPPLRGFESEEK